LNILNLKEKLREFLEKDGSAGPKNGFVSVYASSSRNEDQAETIKEVYFRQAYYASLIKSDASGRYTKKLEILLEYKAISKEAYDKIIAASK
jgi:hypothetical protein